MQDTLNALVAHKASYDAGTYELEDFRAAVENSIVAGLKTVVAKPEGPERQQLQETLSAVLQECRSCDWLSEEQYTKLTANLPAMKKAAGITAGQAKPGELGKIFGAQETQVQSVSVLDLPKVVTAKGMQQQLPLPPLQQSLSKRHDPRTSTEKNPTEEVWQKPAGSFLPPLSKTATNDPQQQQQQQSGGTQLHPTQQEDQTIDGRSGTSSMSSGYAGIVTPPTLTAVENAMLSPSLATAIPSHLRKQSMEERRGGSMTSTVGGLSSRALSMDRQGRVNSAASPSMRQRSGWTPISYFLRENNIRMSQTERTGAQELVKPVRETIRSSQWVSLCTLVILLGLMGWSYFTMVPLLLSRNALWEFVVLILLPILYFFFSFAMKTLVTSVFMTFFSSVRALDKNSEYHSAIPTPIMPGAKLPPVIIQIPVYKEDLHEVIIPTYASVKKAMDFYKERGGEVKLMICEDGLQVLPEDKAGARILFYRRHNIAFCARPPAGRRGLFKKASNMNYTFSVVEQVHHKMKERDCKMHEALTEVWNTRNKEFCAGGDMSIADDAIILLLDADTRIPEEAIYMTMGEFIDCPDLPYTQHFTMPFSDQNKNYWEQTISSFTIKIYTVGIATHTSTGDIAPLVGHNAFLRWSAIKSAAFEDRDDGNKLKYWSESHVSEDFDLFIRLASANRFGRYVTYTGENFQEGVSLTYIDEVIKLRKFAYGACEMVFNKLYLWPFRGPLSPLLIKFVGSRNIRWYQKFGTICYLSTYFALSAGPLLVLMEAVVQVMSPDYYEHYGVYGFDIMLTCTVIFLAFGASAEVMTRWRVRSLQGEGIFQMIWDSIKFAPSITLLFSGVQFQLYTVTTTYFLNLKVVWGATSKETANPTCFEAFVDTWKMFWFQWLVCLPFGVLYVFGIILFTGGIDIVRGWGPIAFVGFHITAPILLNPHIMSLSF